MNDMFVEATRKKYRFPYNGQIGVEDLWDLLPTQLDKVYKTLKQGLKSSDGDSLMKTVTAEDTVLQNKLEIVKFVFDTKQAEKLEAVAKAERDAYKKKVREIIAVKEDQKLADMSVEDLKKLLED